MISRRLSSGEAAVIDKEQSKPKVISRYRYDEEYFPDDIWIPPFFIVLGAVSLALSVMFKKAESLGTVFALVIIALGIVFAIVPIKKLDKRRVFINTLKESKKSGEVLNGRIRSYTLCAEETVSAYKGVWNRGVRLTYVLQIEVGDAKKIMETPKLRYNPNRVLKGDGCKVYLYKNKRYVMDFDLRKKRDDNTADIPRKNIKVEKGYLPPGRGYGAL